MYLAVLGAIISYMVGADRHDDHRPCHASAAAVSGAVGMFVTIFKLMTGAAAALVWLVGGLLVWLAVAMIQSFRHASNAR